LLLGKLSETVVVVGNAPHDVIPRESSDRQPCEFPLHESANAQDPRNELSASDQLMGEMFQAIKPPQPPAAWPLQSSIV